MSLKTRVARLVRHARVPSPQEIWREVVRKAVSCNSYSTDVEIRVLLLIKVDMVRELVEWADAMSKQVYSTPELHYRMHQLFALIRKYPFDVQLTGLNPTAAAQQTFRSAEHRCKRYNLRFRLMRKHPERFPHADVIWHARGFIRSILGDEPNIAAITRACDFTPGAALGVHGNATNLARKIRASSWTVSSHALLPLFEQAIWNNTHITENVVMTHSGHVRCLTREVLRSAIRARAKETPYNKISYVPKTAKTDRSIAVEPLVNSFLQNGVGIWLADRLKRVGLDLRDQSRNSELARQGSLPGQEDPYCTIDLSSASDTLATEVIQELLPPEWFEFLDSLRSKQYIDADGALRRYHKFVSMGNGFCFPLQTLIFASICHASAVVQNRKPDFRVYGDDIIVRRCIAQRTLAYLKFFGFVPNPRKTFIEGNFRESCGTDWWAGVNVRPVFLDHPLDSLERIQGFHNQSIRRGGFSDPYFEEIRIYLRSLVPRSARLLTAWDPGLGQEISSLFPSSISEWGKKVIDGAFWVPYDEYMSGAHVRWNRDTQSFQHFELRSSSKIDNMYAPRRGKVNNALFLTGGLRGGSSETPFTLRFSAERKLVAA